MTWEEACRKAGERLQVQNLRQDIQGFQNRKDGSSLVCFNTSHEAAANLLADKPERLGFVFWIPADVFANVARKEPT